MSKANIIIRMGAAHWDVQVRAPNGNMITFDHRTMSKDEKRVFHRELMNAFRASRRTACPSAI